MSILDLFAPEDHAWLTALDLSSKCALPEVVAAPRKPCPGCTDPCGQCDDEAHS